MTTQDTKDLHQQISALSERVNEAMEVAKHSAEVAYKASIDNQTFNREHKEALKAIQETLKPISDTYQTFARLGKWASALLVIVSIIIGIIIGLKELILKK